MRANHHRRLFLFIFVLGFCTIMFRALGRSSRRGIVFLEKVKKTKSDSTGSTFEGEIIRTFNHPLDDFMSEPAQIRLRKDVSCRKWAVLTTIFEPSEAVRRFGYDTSWCLVIVGDTKSSEKDYKLKSSLGSNIIYLNDKDQVKIGSEFVDALPWRSFGRKNVAYLFAVAHGAEVIYDFDDDNMHKFWVPGSLPSKAFKTINDFRATGHTYKTFKPKNKKGCQVFNPYPYLGGPNSSWPRGFPLNCLRGSNNLYSDAIKEDIVIGAKAPIGVLQSLAENEPDVDAIYRLTQRTPFNFSPHKLSSSPGVILPFGTYSPYNAQATLHFPSAYWALYLPTSVSGRVSDILRSYISKRLFDILQIRVGFLSYPTVVQIRNSHSYLADFNAEIPLYTQVSVLLNYLDSYTPKEAQPTPNVILNLWIGLYERGYVEESDVLIVHKWLQALLHVGYKFPKTQILTSKSSNAPVLNFRVGTTVQAKISSSNNGILPCKKKGVKIWSSDSDQGLHPALDSSLVLSALGQKIYIGSSKMPASNNPSNKVDMELSAIIQDMTRRNEKVSVNKLEALVKKQSSVTEKQIHDSKVMFCHVDLSPCLRSRQKVVALVLGTRFNEKRCSENEWNSRIQEIKNMSSNVFISSQHRFDAEYLRHFTNIDAPLLPPVGSLFHATKYNPKGANKKTILFLGGEEEKSQDIVNGVKGFLLKKVTAHTLPEDLNGILAAIYVPQDVISYDLSRIYAMNVPIFSPSLEFLRGKKLLSRINRCKTLGSVPPYTQTWHPSDPGNDGDELSQLYWWQLSDSFDLPHILHFKDSNDLMTKLKSSNFEDIARRMKYENEIRRSNAAQTWCDLISKAK